MKEIYLSPSIKLSRNSLIIIPWLELTTKVLIGSLFSGGVEMIENSLSPSIAIDKVLGIGVAVSAKTSTFFLNAFSFPFAEHQIYVLINHNEPKIF